MNRRNAFLTGMLVLASTVSASAASFEKLIGAWTMVGTDCADNFVRDGDRWQFKDRNSSLNTGLIISGRTISGTYGTCKFGRIIERDDHFVAMLGCESAVMFSDFAVHFRVVDDTHFARFDPDFPEFAITYQKCTP